MKFAKMLITVLALALVVSFSAVAADEVTMTGTLEKAEAGLVLKAEAETVNVAGAADEALVGKKVEATGTVAEAEGVKTLTVTAIKAVE